jgi:V-type H+-transporting ATPase subunit a
LAGLVAISYLAGTIDKEEQYRFKKMVYRATRGKALTHFADIYQQELKSYTGKIKERPRVVYVILFQEGAHVREKLLRICDSFLGQRFDIPANNDVQEI